MIEKSRTKRVNDWIDAYEVSAIDRMDAATHVHEWVENVFKSWTWVACETCGEYEHGGHVLSLADEQDDGPFLTWDCSCGDSVQMRR